jgi:hypothetical protein
VTLWDENTWVVLVGLVPLVAYLGCCAVSNRRRIRAIENARGGE